MRNWFVLYDIVFTRYKSGKWKHYSGWRSVRVCLCECVLFSALDGIVWKIGKTHSHSVCRSSCMCHHFVIEFSSTECFMMSKHKRALLDTILINFNEDEWTNINKIRKPFCLHSNCVKQEYNINWTQSLIVKLNCALKTRKFCYFLKKRSEGKLVNTQVIARKMSIIFVDEE